MLLQLKNLTWTLYVSAADSPGIDFVVPTLRWNGHPVVLGISGSNFNLCLFEGINIRLNACGR